MSLFGLIKAQQNVGTKKLQALVNGKSVAVVGNASSLFGKNQGAEIDAHDVVIRLNRGFIIDQTQQGSRTDIVGTARPFSVEQIEQYDPQLVYWLFWRRWRIPTWNDAIWNLTEVVPLDVWRASNRTMKKRPTSGFVMSHVLAQHTTAKDIAVYGFDFYQSGNFYRGDKISMAHDHDDERDAFLKMRDRNHALRLV